MPTFVGAEYLIANMLVSKARNRKMPCASYVSVEELTLCGVRVRHLSSERGIDAVFLTFLPNIYDAIYDFTDYFSCDYEGGRLTGITINSEKRVEDLEARFMGRIPEEIVKILDRAIKELAA